MREALRVNHLRPLQESASHFPTIYDYPPLLGGVVKGVIGLHNDWIHIFSCTFLENGASHGCGTLAELMNSTH